MSAIVDRLTAVRRAGAPAPSEADELDLINDPDDPESACYTALKTPDVCLGSMFILEHAAEKAILPIVLAWRFCSRPPLEYFLPVDFSAVDTLLPNAAHALSVLV